MFEIDYRLLKTDHDTEMWLRFLIWKKTGEEEGGAAKESIKSMFLI